jgi:hypothetical protein
LRLARWIDQVGSLSDQHLQAAAVQLTPSRSPVPETRPLICQLSDECHDERRGYPSDDDPSLTRPKHKSKIATVIGVRVFSEFIVALTVKSGGDTASSRCSLNVATSAAEQVETEALSLVGTQRTSGDVRSMSVMGRGGHSPRHQYTS